VHGSSPAHPRSGDTTWATHISLKPFFPHFFYHGTFFFSQYIFFSTIFFEFFIIYKIRHPNIAILLQIKFTDQYSNLLLMVSFRTYHFTDFSKKSIGIVFVDMNLQYYSIVIYDNFFFFIINYLKISPKCSMKS